MKCHPLLLSKRPVLPAGLKPKAWVLGALADKSYRKKHGGGGGQTGVSAELLVAEAGQHG